MIVFAEFDAATFVTCASTVILAILTGSYVYLTHRLLLAQTDPCVIVYARNPSTGRIQIVVENIGNGIARDVRFKHSEPIPWEHKKGAASPPLTNAIAALAPQHRRIFDWGSHQFLIAQCTGKAITVSCEFKRAENRYASEDPISIDCILEIDSFSYDEYQADPLKACAESLSQIQLSMQSLVTRPHR